MGSAAGQYRKKLEAVNEYEKRRKYWKLTTYGSIAALIAFVIMIKACDTYISNRSCPPDTGLDGGVCQKCQD